MTQNKLLPAKVILVLIILLSLGTVLGVTAYSLNLENNPTIAVQPTPTPKITPKLDCPSTVTDIDGNTYNTVQISSRCWMKENLKVTKNPEGKEVERYCYESKIGEFGFDTCDTNGGLYAWDVAMNGSVNKGSQGICPNGWHIPKDSEWYNLEAKFTTKSSCSSDRNDIDGIADDCDPAGQEIVRGGSSGFEGLLSGFRDIDGLFYGRGQLAFFWSSTAEGTDAWSREISLWHSYRRAYDKAMSFSVRCLKD